MVFIDRNLILKDMHAIDRTQTRISQVESKREWNGTNDYSFVTSSLPCSCKNCRLSCLSELCSYKSVRHLEQQVVNDKEDTSITDPQGFNKLTVKTLQIELKERGLKMKGRKKELVIWLRSFLEEIEEN